MSILAYTKEKAMLAAALAIVGMVAYWTFSVTALQSLDVRPSPLAPVVFIIFAILCLPLLISIMLINRLGDAIVLNSTILALATVLTLVYLYVLACIIMTVWNRIRH